MNNVASYTNMNRSKLSRDLSIQFCRQQQPDNDWWLMTSDKSNKWQQQQATTINRATSTTNDNDNDDKTPAKGQERFNRENSNKCCRVGNNVSLLICMWTWTQTGTWTWFWISLSTSLSFHNWISNRLSWHTQSYTHAHTQPHTHLASKSI